MSSFIQKTPKIFVFSADCSAIANWTKVSLIRSVWGYGLEYCWNGYMLKVNKSLCLSICLHLFLKVWDVYKVKSHHWMFITLTELVGFILHGQNLLFSKKIYFLFLLCSLLASNPFLFLHKIFVPLFKLVIWPRYPRPDLSHTVPVYALFCLFLSK